VSRITRRASEARNRGIRGVLRRRPELPRRAVQPWRRVPTSLKILLGSLLVLMLLVGAEGYLSRVRRTAETPAQIVSIDSHANPGKGAKGGYVIGYAFEADGATHSAIARRSWSFESIQAAKVCYEPANAANQTLTLADEPCG
jgi:hypothetical protein